MSKILRRPMFRGGPVNSEGTGITSGLNQGYADGGRIGYAEPTINNNFGLATRRPGFNLFSKYDQSADVSSNDEFMNDMFMRSIYGNDYASQDTSNTPVSGMQRRLEKIKSNIPVSNREINKILLEKGEINKDSSIKDVISAQRKYQEELINKKPEVTQAETETDRLKKIIEEMKKARTDELAKLKETVTAAPVESDVSQWAKEARDLLGYEEAKKQSIYDALLAASPAFFKGRTLREAAPNILEAVSKSGAFDKPTNIKQAAAQLAIQRKMLQEKAVAEEKTRYGLLEAKEGYKSKDPIERLKALGIDPNMSWGGKLPDSPLLYKSGKFYVNNQGNLVKVEIDEKTKLPSLINFG